MRRRNGFVPALCLCFVLLFVPSLVTAQDIPQEPPKSEYEGIPSSDLLTRLHKLITDQEVELQNITRRSVELEAKIAQLETAQTEQLEEQTKQSELLRSYSAEIEQLKQEKQKIQNKLIIYRIVSVVGIVTCIISLTVRR